MPRADGERNRQRLLDAALAAFSAGSGTVPLDVIARDAGVGIGTLYRHFPSREALVEAVYRAELARLCDGIGDLLGAHPPDVALRTWFEGYLDFVATKRGMAEALREVLVSGAITSGQTRERLGVAIGAALEAGVADGTLRGDVRPEDVAAALAGVMLSCRAPEQRAQAGRMLDLLLDGLRPR